VIDDDPVLRETLDRVLEELGWGSEPAENGREGVEKAVQGGHAAILLDYDLPDIDGLEVLDRLQATELRTPVIAITGKGDEEVALRFLSGGAVDYVTKGNLTPERLAQALDRARWVTQGTGPRPPDPIEADRGGANPSRRVLFYASDDELESMVLDGLDRASWPARPVRLASLSAIGPASGDGAKAAVVADLRNEQDPSQALERVLAATPAPVLAVVGDRSIVDVPEAERGRTSWIVENELSTVRMLEALKQAAPDAQRPTS
jgi:CheY-like chemotaxis protein